MSDEVSETPVPNGPPVVSAPVDESAFTRSTGPIVDGVQMPSEDPGPKTVEEDDPPVATGWPEVEAETDTDESIPDCPGLPEEEEDGDEVVNIDDEVVDIVPEPPELYVEEEEEAPPPTFDVKVTKKEGKRVWLDVRNLTDDPLEGVFQISAAGKFIERELKIEADEKVSTMIKSKKFVKYDGYISVKFGKQIFEAK